jgi:hypothetical protein
MNIVLVETLLFCLLSIFLPPHLSGSADSTVQPASKRLSGDLVSGSRLLRAASVFAYTGPAPGRGWRSFSFGSEEGGRRFGGMS